MRYSIGLAAALLVMAVAAPAHAGLPRGSERVKLDPADFTTKIDNPYWPMKPGTRWVYREIEPGARRQKVVVTVTRGTKRISNGVTARVVHDVVTEGRELVEVTDDWYAQDRRGNVWYLGEATKEYPLERRVLEFKFYARGVGPVLAINVSGGSGREELVRFRRGR